MDGAGDAVVAWRESTATYTRIRIATRTPGGYLARVDIPNIDGGYASPPGDGDATTPRVAVAPDGSAVVVWSRLLQTNPVVQRQIEAVYRKGASGPWSFVEAVANNSGAVSGDVAIDPAGNATFAWIQDYDIKARTHLSTGGYESLPQTVYTQSQAQVDPLLFEPHVAVDAAGNQLIAWADSPTSTITDRFSREVRSAQRAPGGAWEAAKLIATRAPEENLILVADVAIHDGTAVVEAVRGRGSAATEILTRPAGAADYASKHFYADGEYGTDTSGVAFDSSGNALIAFKRHDGRAPDTVAYAYRPAGGDWSAAPLPIAGAGEPYRAGPVEADSSGNFTMMWGERDANGNDILYAATRAPGDGAAFGAPQAISEPRPAGEPAGEIGYANQDMAVSGSGEAMAVWSHTDGDALRAEAAYGHVKTIAPPPVVVPPPPPPAPTVSAIATARPLASGKPAILTLKFNGPVDRLEWKIGDNPTMVALPVNGQVPTSIRARTPLGSFKVSVTAVGPGGGGQFTRSFNAPNNPTDATSRKVKVPSSVAVQAVGKEDVLLGKTAACGNLQITAKTQRYEGCFRPIDGIADIPAGERGVLDPLARAFDVSPSDATTVARAVELSDGYVATGSMLINSTWPVVPSGGAKIVSFPQAKLLSSSKAAFRIGGQVDRTAGQRLHVRPGPGVRHGHRPRDAPADRADHRR